MICSVSIINPIHHSDLAIGDRLRPFHKQKFRATCYVRHKSRGHVSDLDVQFFRFSGFQPAGVRREVSAEKNRLILDLEGNVVGTAEPKISAGLASSLRRAAKPYTRSEMRAYHKTSPAVPVTAIARCLPVTAFVRDSVSGLLRCRNGASQGVRDSAVGRPGTPTFRRRRSPG